jgi:polyribonucleotide nucleotidyltransferase
MAAKTWTLDIAGRTMTFETGHWAKQANGAVSVRYGDTQMLATATMSPGIGFVTHYFPLMVDYEERYYAAGKIKGSRFIKREGRPSDEAVLAGRVVDRTIRPLFNGRMRNDTQVVVTAHSFDGENDPDVVSVIAASAALHTSDIPWGGPVAAVRIGMIDGKFVVNPTKSELINSTLNLTLAGTAQKINMIEAGAQEITDEDLQQAFELGHSVIKEIAGFIEKIRTEIGKEKAEPFLLKLDDSIELMIRETIAASELEDALYGNKKEIAAKTSAVQENVKKEVEEKILKDHDALPDMFKDAFYLIFDEVSDEIVHKNILSIEKRPDGRKIDEIRQITCDIGVLPRPHGSGVFTRGETQVLTVTTLGAPGDHQIIDTMEVDIKKHYIHHYNFPAYSVGEVRPNRGPGRREIGHGALAEKALIPVIPERDEFPYTVLLVSEVMESNGSSSMASTCGSTLSLMHAGVPIKRPVSGIAMGMIVGDDGAFKVLSDIQGAEDHYGDMDLKVAGSEKGITALQMDVKLDGVTLEMLKAAIAQANTGRAHILGEMMKTISQPNEELSPYAPRIITMTIDPEKIRDVIGKGGETINKIIDETGASIDIEDDGTIFITAPDGEGGAKAQEWISNLTKSIEVGEVYEGEVVRIMDFGAFVELLPGQDGLVHVSELDHKRVEKVTDVVKAGDTVRVKVKEIDEKGRINLSMKALKDKPSSIPEL